jgi:serine protease Do
MLIGVRADLWGATMTLYSRVGLLCLLGAAGVLPAGAQSAIERQSLALNRASDAVVGLQARAVEDARTLTTLGRDRQGSGVVIGEDGLVLTIGYLILEAETVDLVTGDERPIPARVVAYDVASGFGLVQALAPLRLAPVPLGDAASLDAAEPLTVASGGSDGSVGAGRLVSRRAFSAFWEYHLDNALFVSPQHDAHGGAGLFNGRGELVGIGSLRVTDALGGDAPREPATMFVPIDLLKPILGELRERGRSRQSERAWIGLNCIEQGGMVRVVRVSEDSPADVAGLQPGDQIVRIDGTRVGRLEQLWKTLWAGASAERAVSLEIQREGELQTLTVQTVDRAKTLRRAQGI